MDVKSLTKLKEMMLKIDIHIHTTRSPDAIIDIEQLPSILRTRHLDGVAVTDHDRFFNEEIDGTIIIPGIEVSAQEGHILGLGLIEEISPNLPADETIRIIHDRGGVAILAHPYDIIRGGIRPTEVTEQLDGIETINSKAHPFKLTKYLAEKSAKRLNIPTVGGSDSHSPETVGDAYTTIESRSTSIHDILDAIRSGKVNACGGPSGSVNELKRFTRALSRKV